MKKKISVFALILMIMAAVFCIAACGDDGNGGGSGGGGGGAEAEINCLSAPVVSIDASGLATWPEVEHSSGYKYMINRGDEQTAAGRSVQLQDNDEIQVRAVGNGVNYSDSEWSEVKKYIAPKPYDAYKGYYYEVVVDAEDAQSPFKTGSYLFDINGDGDILVADESIGALTVDGNTATAVFTSGDMEGTYDDIVLVGGLVVVSTQEGYKVFNNGQTISDDALAYINNNKATLWPSSWCGVYKLVQKNTRNGEYTLYNDKYVTVEGMIGSETFSVTGIDELPQSGSADAYYGLGVYLGEKDTADYVMINSVRVNYDYIEDLFGLWKQSVDGISCVAYLYCGEVAAFIGNTELQDYLKGSDNSFVPLYMTVGQYRPVYKDGEDYVLGAADFAIHQNGLGWTVQSARTGVTGTVVYENEQLKLSFTEGSFSGARKYEYTEMGYESPSSEIHFFNSRVLGLADNSGKVYMAYYNSDKCELNENENAEMALDTLNFNGALDEYGTYRQIQYNSGNWRLANNDSNNDYTVTIRAGKITFGNTCGVKGIQDQTLYYNMKDGIKRVGTLNYKYDFVVNVGSHAKVVYITDDVNGEDATGAHSFGRAVYVEADYNGSVDDVINKDFVNTWGKEDHSSCTGTYGYVSREELRDLPSNSEDSYHFTVDDTTYSVTLNSNGKGVIKLPGKEEISVFDYTFFESEDVFGYYVTTTVIVIQVGESIPKYMYFILQGNVLKYLGENRLVLLNDYRVYGISDTVLYYKGNEVDDTTEIEGRVTNYDILASYVEDYYWMRRAVNDNGNAAEIAGTYILTREYGIGSVSYIITLNDDRTYSFVRRRVEYNNESIELSVTGTYLLSDSGLIILDCTNDRVKFRLEHTTIELSVMQVTNDGLDGYSDISEWYSSFGAGDYIYEKQ